MGNGEAKRVYQATSEGLQALAGVAHYPGKIAARETLAAVRDSAKREWSREELRECVARHWRELLNHAGDDPTRPGLLETPDRIARSWEHLFSGYGAEAGLEKLLKQFDEPAEEMVILRNCELYSTCEHHFQPFYGRVHVAYIPNGKRVVGLSKLARVVEVYARRLQVQERICQQVVDALVKHLQPRGAACVIEAKHFCVMARGVEKQHSDMVTSATRGAFRDDPATRAEFMNLIARV